MQRVTSPGSPPCREPRTSVARDAARRCRGNGRFPYAGMTGGPGQDRRQRPRPYGSSRTRSRSRRSATFAHVIPFRGAGLSNVLTPGRQGVFLRLYSSTAGASRTASFAFRSSESGGARWASLRRYSSRRRLYLSSRCCPASVISRPAIRSPAPGRSRPAGFSTKKQTRIPRSRCTSRRTGAPRHSSAVHATRERRHPPGIPPPGPLCDPPWYRRVTFRLARDLGDENPACLRTLTDHAF